MTWSAAMAKGAETELRLWGRAATLELAGAITGYDTTNLVPIDDADQQVEITATLADDAGVRQPVGPGGELSLIDAVWSFPSTQLAAGGAARDPQEGDRVVEYDGTAVLSRWSVTRVDRPANSVWMRLFCRRVQ